MRKETIHIIESKRREARMKKKPNYMIEILLVVALVVYCLIEI